MAIKKPKKERLFIIRKIVSAVSVSEALKKEKSIEPEEIFPMQEKNNQSTYAVGFNADTPDDDTD